ncbi:unnamed protein product [Ixodes pacificus]
MQSLVKVTNFIALVLLVPLNLAKKKKKFYTDFAKCHQRNTKSSNPLLCWFQDQARGTLFHCSETCKSNN